MTGQLIVESAGPGTTIQDAGRFGLLRYGVTPAGPMDWVAFQTVHRALGTGIDGAVIEIAGGGLSLRAVTRCLVAFAGGGFEWTLGGQTLPAAARVLLRPGESLRTRAGSWGAFAYCGAAGGLDIPPVMGSRATHLRSRLGGLNGRGLQSGDLLDTGDQGNEADDVAIDAPWLHRSDAPIGIVLGPQDDHFSEATIAAFLDSAVTLTAQADRMAYKFEGPKRTPIGDFNIVSDGVALGAIQIAGDGQPMVLMADRQPTGGYPKIAHVCRADIGRLAQLRPGDTCRFHAVLPAQARQSLMAIEDRLTSIEEHLVPLRLVPRAELLSAENLISGVTGGPERR